MGRYTQQRRRGGGVPAFAFPFSPPTVGEWGVYNSGGDEDTVTNDSTTGGGYWMQAQYRLTGSSGAWSASGFIAIGDSLPVPTGYTGVNVDWQVRHVAATGGHSALSDWSATQTVTNT